MRNQVNRSARRDRGASNGKKPARSGGTGTTRSRSLRLDLGSGIRPRDGFESVDFFEKKAKWQVDLTKFPWPWADGAVEELNCSHFLEHIPAETTSNGRDLLVQFMDEAWRVLRDGGKFTVIVPNARSNRAFQDPTHRRFFVSESFLYYNENWRRTNGLSHYLGVCDFDMDVRVTCPPHVAHMSEKERYERFNSDWNTIWDWYVILTKRRPSPGRKKRTTRKP